MNEVSEIESVAAAVDALCSESRYSEALEVIAETWPDLFAIHGERLRKTIERIPATEWQDRPWILAAVGATFTSIDSMSRSAALPWFEAAEHLIAIDGTHPVGVVAGVQVHLAGVHRSLGNLVSARASATAAREALASDVGLPPPSRVKLQASTELHLGVVALHLGEHDEARRHLHLANGLREGANSTGMVEGLAVLAYLSYLEGDFSRAVELASQARLSAAALGIATSRFIAPALSTEILIAVEQDRLDDALTAVPIASQAGAFSEWEPLTHHAVGSVAAISGHLIEGLDEIRSAITSTFGWQPQPNIRSTSEKTRGVLLMDLGELDEATAIFETLSPSHNHAQCPARYLAAIRLTTGDIAGTLDALRDCGTLGDRHSSRTLVDVLLLRAAANYELGHERMADVALDRALLMASRNGMRRPFHLIPTAVLARMLERAATRHQPESVRRMIPLLLRAKGESTAQSVAVLSTREREIALALELDKTVSQIAAELFISTNTVKTHLRSIYRKIDASTRQEAMARLRSLGIGLEVEKITH